MSNAQAVAQQDLVTGLTSFRAWSALAVDDLIARYSRTVIGPLWMAIAHAFFVFGYAFWSAAILKMDMSQQLPYVAAGLTIWAWISGSLVEAGSIYLRAIPLLTAYDLPVSLHVHRAVAGQFFSFCHNMLVFIAAIALVGFVPSWKIIMVIPGIVCVYICCIGWSLALGLLGARYRDVSPLIMSIIGMLFILTPVFWRREDVGAAHLIADLNPFYHLLEIVREPLLGNFATTTNWLVAIGVTLLSVGLGVSAFIVNRSRLAYWL